jgi:hypothetical protein
MNDESSEIENEKPRYLLPAGCSDLIDALRRDAESRSKSNYPENPDDIIDF